MKKTKKIFQTYNTGELKTTTDGTIVLCSGMDYEANFEGVIISSNDISFTVGQYSRMFIKRYFKDYYGEIVVKNRYEDIRKSK